MARLVIFGAGAAGLGVTRQIKAQLVDEGVVGEQQAQVIAVLDRAGLLIDDGRPMDEYKRALAWPAARAAALGLAAPAQRSLRLASIRSTRVDRSTAGLTATVRIFFCMVPGLPLVSPLEHLAI